MMTIFNARIKVNRYFANKAETITFKTETEEVTFDNRLDALSWLDLCVADTVELVQVSFE